MWQGTRPAINRDMPSFYASLMTRCWDPTPAKRPDYAEVSLDLLAMADRLKIPTELLSPELKAFHQAQKAKKK